MEEKKLYTPKDERSCYRIPKGYFEALTAEVVNKAQTTPIDPHFNNSWGTIARRMMGFVAGFALLVGLAATAFYFTPEAAMNQHKQRANNVDVEEFTALYDVTEDDILEYYYPSQDEQQLQNAQLAQDIDEYLTTYPMASINEEDIDF